jgi:carboxypeptidase PM20D1
MKKETWRILLLITGLGLALLVTTLLTRTILLTSKQVQVEGRPSNVSIDRNEAAERLSHAIQFKTISHSDETQFDKAAFIDFQNYIEQAFPLVHAQLTKEIINQYSLLYTWKGQDENLKPMLLMGHLDVVPVEAGTDKEWQYPPFEGRIADGYIWGRGAMDDKSSMLGILEAVEILLEEEFKPQRTIYLAFGHDEEIGGHTGAAEIAALLQSRGIELEYVLDEGLAIGEDFVPFLSRPVALVGIAEKGYVHVELSVESKGGHSSVPPSHTTIGILSAAIYKLERNPFPLELTEPIAQMLEY